MKKVLKKIRQFFYLTPRDLGLQISSVEEIAEGMKDTGPIDDKLLPWEFASTMSKILGKK
ncbi:MAG: hypothetical protein L6Q29_03955 [Candidatus Pacebacteria bacterium]|nr:hypothetical protein [Candidatus Paceibacterota bacterium]NUQ57286.1 hypothetical protein [Candidatus Paceibacter sp.]